MPNIDVVMPVNFKYVPGVRTLVAKASMSFGFDDQEAYQIETIVDELCNNAIEHGSSGEAQWVQICCTIEKDNIEIVVIDSGPKEIFDLEKSITRGFQLLEEEKKEPRICERRGRGLVIVKKLSDHLDIDLTGQGTIIKVIKKGINNPSKGDQHGTGIENELQGIAGPGENKSS